MDMNHSFWEENSNIQQVKYESYNTNDEGVNCCDTANLNFSTGDEDCSEYSNYRKSAGTVRVSRQDPMSHRIIEKRRRDRMNNCLADLSRLIPAEYLKKGRGRIEKTEIIEMAIKHMKHLQYLNHYRLGYQDCMSETMRFMVEVEGHFPREPLCMRLLGHLQQHCDTICRSTPDGQPQQVPLPTTQETKIERNNNYEETTLQTQHNESNAYKYKNDIKLRFNQDLNSAKRPKLLPPRRSSSTSNENQSHGSPSRIELNGRYLNESETNTNRVSPVDNTIIESPIPLTRTSSIDNKINFSVPVFVLHAKGSFYIPLTLDYHTLLPYLGSFELLHLENDVVLHPVAINVHFQQRNDSSNKIK